jgi:hypothetical protein
VSLHPRRVAPPGAQVVRYFLRSRAFAGEFGNVTGAEIFRTLRTFCFGNRGPLGIDEVLLPNLNGEQHVFHLETFYNGHEALTLGVHRRARAPLVIVPG